MYLCQFCRKRAMYNLPWFDYVPNIFSASHPPLPIGFLQQRVCVPIGGYTHHSNQFAYPSYYSQLVVSYSSASWIRQCARRGDRSCKLLPLSPSSSPLTVRPSCCICYAVEEFVISTHVVLIFFHFIYPSCLLCNSVSIYILVLCDFIVLL